MSFTVVTRANVGRASCRTLRYVVADSQRRSMSTVLLRHGLGCASHRRVQRLGDSRSLWWPGKASVPKDIPAVDVPSSSPTTPAASGDPLSANVTNVSDGQSTVDIAPVTASTPAPPPLDVSTAAAATPSPIDTAASIVSSTDIPLPPIQLGDMTALGLVHYTPAGFFPWLLEATHVFTGMPWWGTIILVTGLARASVFPFVVKGARTASKMALIQPQVKKLQEDMMRARERNDSLLLTKTMMEQRSVFKQHGINPMSPIITSVAQITVQLGFFFGLRRMCELPVEQLKTGGISFFTDLTVADPYYVLPVVNVLAMNLQLSLASRDVMGTTPSAPHVMNAFRVLSVVGLGFLMNFPAGLNLHLTASIMLICLQTLLLRIPRVRKFFKLSTLPAVSKKPPTLMESFAYMKQSWRNQLAQKSRELEEREHLKKMARPRRK